MWQRIQTLYIALATALVAALFFTEKAEGIGFTGYVPYLVLAIVISLLNLLALTTYKHRIFQMRTVTLSAIITAALQAWLVVDFIMTRDSVLFRFPSVFPVIAVIFDVLAIRGIMADELVVRSASRLRSAKRRQH